MLSYKLSQQIRNSKFLIFFNVLSVLYWSTQLIYTSAYYVCYLLIGIISIFSYYFNHKDSNAQDLSSIFHYPKNMVFIFSLFYSFIITIANYNIGNLISLLTLFLTGIIVFKNILNIIINKLSFFTLHNENNSISAKKIFGLAFLIIVTINLATFFLGFYPGIFTYDSMKQVTQILTDNYSNHHPFYHTQVIKIFFCLGMWLFNDINAAIATYNVFQIIFMAICFAFALSTLAKLKVPIKIIITIGLFYTLMPYHIMYSFTMWKDIIFGGCTLLLITLIIRIAKNIGSNFYNYIFLFFSSIGICLFRNNGFTAFLLFTIFSILLFKTQRLRLIIIFIAALLLSVFMKHPLLNYLNVQEIHTAWHFSIPAQQIARVIVEKHPLTTREIQLLEQIIDVKEVSKKYKPYIADNIINLIIKKGNENLLVKNKIEYFKLYTSLGIKYPLSYARAWIDQTKGYWNAGYEYWRWGTGVRNNDLGIKLTTQSHKFRSFFDKYLKAFSEVQILRIFLSIGFFVWINLLMLFISLYRNDKLGIVVALPTIMITLTLCVATPVFSEFRYIYAIFCTIPLIIIIPLRASSKNLINNSIK